MAFVNGAATIPDDRRADRRGGLAGPGADTCDLFAGCITFWVVSSAPSSGDLRRFRTLQIALNFEGPEDSQSGEPAASSVW
jgi:hypothetical protein